MTYNGVFQETTYVQVHSSTEDNQLQAGLTDLAISYERIVVAIQLGYFVNYEINGELSEDLVERMCGIPEELERLRAKLIEWVRGMNEGQLRAMDTVKLV